MIKVKQEYVNSYVQHILYMHKDETGGLDSTQRKIHSHGRLERSWKGGKLYVGV